MFQVGPEEQEPSPEGLKSDAKASGFNPFFLLIGKGWKGALSQ